MSPILSVPSTAPLMSRGMPVAPWFIHDSLAGDKGQQANTAALCGPILVAIGEPVEPRSLAKPYVIFLPTPRFKCEAQWSSFQEEHDLGKVNNDELNALIARVAKSLKYAGKTTLILVENLEHGKQILQQLSNLNGVCASGQAISPTTPLSDEFQLRPCPFSDVTGRPDGSWSVSILSDRSAIQPCVASLAR